MSDPLPLGKKTLSVGGQKKLTKSKKKLSLALILMLSGSIMNLMGIAPLVQHAYADTENESALTINSPLFERKNELFAPRALSETAQKDETKIPRQNNDAEERKNASDKPLSDKIYAMVGDAPIKEMVPFISQRDHKVAAFLVGIAKKESSFGLASPSKDGKTCYNYWGLKGQGQRGEGMGYACFASAQEAVDTVGNKIEDLVAKNRTTPSAMVDTWKCGTSCKDDPGAPAWVSTVAMYFNQLVEKNG